MGRTVVHDEYNLTPLSKLPDGTYLMRMVDSDGQVNAFPMTREAAVEFFTLAYREITGVIVPPIADRRQAK